MPTSLSASAAPTEVHDVAMLDLDGVVYVAKQAVPGAPEHLREARERGLRLGFVTNNASRAPAVVARTLSDLGVPAEAADVVTSAQAAARVLADRFGPGARVLALGAEGLLSALTEGGLVHTSATDDPDVVAVVTGYGPDVLWRDIMRVAVRIREGLPWVASNTDLTIPTAYGIGPGHGVLVRMLSDFTDVTPDVAGKPAPPLLEETVRRLDAGSPLMVGDRLDTDIEGGNALEIPTLLVMTGVTDLAALAGAPSPLRPTLLADDLAGLLEEHPEVRMSGGQCRSGGWVAGVSSGTLRVSRVETGEAQTGARPDAGRSDWWRAAAVAAWDHLDRTGEAADVAGSTPPDR